MSILSHTIALPLSPALLPHFGNSSTLITQGPRLPHQSIFLVPLIDTLMRHSKVNRLHTVWALCSLIMCSYLGHRYGGVILRREMVAE